MEAEQLRLSAEEIANRLDRPQRTKSGWLACCPAHSDRSPSLSVKDGDRGFPVFFCYAGCTYEAIAAALGISSESPVAPPPPPAPPPRKPKPEAEGEAVADRLLTGEELAIQPEFYRQPHHDFMQRREQYFPYLTAAREVWATIKRVDIPGQPKKVQPTTTLPDGPRPLYLLPELMAQSERAGPSWSLKARRRYTGRCSMNPNGQSQQASAARRLPTKQIGHQLKTGRSSYGETMTRPDRSIASRWPSYASRQARRVSTSSKCRKNGRKNGTLRTRCHRAQPLTMCSGWCLPRSRGRMTVLS